MRAIIKQLQKFGKPVLIIFLLIGAFIAGNSTGFANNNVTKAKVLSAHIHVTPSPTLTPNPTNTPVVVINNIIVPTQAPVVITQVVTPTPVPTTPTPTSVPSTPTPTIQPTVTITPSAEQNVPTSTPTPTPTPISQTVEVDVDYAGQHATSMYTTTITSGETAWQAVQDAVGLASLQYTDYGGSLGIFITGFNGVSAASNQYYDFQVNGTSSNVGVSSYTVQNHDVLKFVLTSF